MASLTLEQVRKTFGEVEAVVGMDLSVSDGEFIAFLGPSGCGKTTTLRLISGLETPTSGKIFIGDRDVTDVRPRNRDVAMVFQDYALYPHMTTFDNIGYPLKVRGISKSDMDQRVTEVANRLQIGELLDRRPGQLSGGQQQRTALARALVHQAQVFLFDEPLSNLDAKLRIEARAFLKHLQQEVGVTSVYVTHDQAEAMALADRIVVMQAGHIMQTGSPREIYRKPANVFVASFIGNPPMNLLPCKMEGNRLVLQSESGNIPLKLDSQLLPDHLASGEPVTVGIRPEDIQFRDTESPNSMLAKHYVTQMLGNEILILVQIGEHIMSIRSFEDDMPELPDQVWLTFNSQRIFFFGSDGELIK